MGAQQLELHVPGGDNLTGTLSTRVFAPTLLYDHRYHLAEHPTFYFIVVRDKDYTSGDTEGVNLYREGTVNVLLRGDDRPYTAWVSNEPRNNRRIETIYADMVEKVEQMSYRLR